jgi:hypothetical protein
MFLIYRLMFSAARSACFDSRTKIVLRVLKYRSKWSGTDPSLEVLLVDLLTRVRKKVHSERSSTSLISWFKLISSKAVLVRPSGYHLYVFPLFVPLLPSLTKFQERVKPEGTPCNETATLMASLRQTKSVEYSKVGQELGNLPEPCLTQRVLLVVGCPRECQIEDLNYHKTSVPHTAKFITTPRMAGPATQFSKLSSSTVLNPHCLCWSLESQNLGPSSLQQGSFKRSLNTSPKTQAPAVATCLGAVRLRRAHCP